MRTLTQRQIKILQCFHKSEILTSSQITQVMHLSGRTLRNEIKDINEAYPTLILSIKSQGYQLNMEHPWLSEVLKDKEEVYEKTRYLFILKQILAKEETDYYELAEQLYISESTLDKQIISINEIINRRDPTSKIERRNNKLYINGSEKQHRQIFTYLMNHEMDQYNFNLSNYTQIFTSFSLSEIKAYVLEFNRIYHLEMRDVETISFILHIAIMMERIQKGREVTGILGYQPSKEADNLASEFAKGLSTRFHISVSSLEHQYLSCLFAGKISDMNSDKIDEYRNFIEEIINDINKIYEFDLHSDTAFSENLLIHLLGLDSRIRSGSFLSNPLIKDIKLHFPLLYDVSVFIASKIQNHFHANLLEDEIGYITLHVMSAVEKLQEYPKKRLVILNPLGNGISNYLTQKLTKNQTIDIEICGVFSMFDLTTIESCHPDLIISCFPIHEPTSIPIYTCSGFPKEQDYERILHLLQVEEKQTSNASTFFHESLFFPKQNFSSKEEVIHFLCEQLMNQGYCENGYEEKVLAREKIAPTSYGGAFAIPHPIEKCANQHAIAVAILKQPILWNNKKIRMVFLFALAPHKNRAFDEVFEQLVSLLDEPSKMKNMIKEDTLDAFLNVFTQP